MFYPKNLAKPLVGVPYHVYYRSCFFHVYLMSIGVDKDITISIYGDNMGVISEWILTSI